jgi:gliding motility-associated-like protein
MKKSFWSLSKALTLFSLLTLNLTFQTNAQFFSISGGHEYSASVCQDGGILQWGRIIKTTNGTTVAVNKPEAVPLPAGVFFTKIDAGSGSHGLATDCNNQVWAWGSNSSEDNGSGNINGQLGSATLKSSDTPIPVSGVGGVGQLIATYISGSNRASFAITSDGYLVSWGSNEYQELGRPITGTFDPIPNYVLKSDGSRLSKVVQVDGGDATIYALDEGGYVYSWGYNKDLAWGRNGADGATSRLPNNVLKADNTPLGNIITITAGDRHGLALADDGTVWAWGGNWGPNQLGYSGGNSGTAKQVVGVGNTGILKNVVGISAGQASSVAVLGDGSVVTWGSNCFYGLNNGVNAGELGQGSTICNSGSSTSYIPNYVVDENGARIRKISSISDGDAVYYAVNNVGDIYVWGYNVDGELGLSTNVNSGSAKLLPIGNCRLPDPCPAPNLGPDISVCNASQLTNVTFATQYFESYKYKWFFLSPGGVSTNVTIADTNIFRPTVLGKYVVEVTPNQLACSVCEVGYDTISVDQPNLTSTYCNLTNNNLVFRAPNTTGTFKWWLSQTGTADSLSPRGTTFTIAKNSLTPQVTGEDTVYNLYLEDKTIYTGATGPITTAGLTTNGQRNAGNNDLKVRFDVGTAFMLNSVSVLPYIYNAGTFNFRFELKQNGNTLQSINFRWTATTTGQPVAIVEIPVNFPIPIGTGYTLEYVNANIQGEPTPDIAFYNPATYPYIVSPNIFTLLEMASHNGSYNGIAFFNWKYTANASNSCGRLRVSLVKDCPCNAPASVAITSSTGINGFCTSTVSSLVLDAKPSPVTPTITPFNYLYQWYKNGTPVADPVGKVNSINISSKDGAATYVFRVGHSSLQRSKCYTEVPITITNENPISDNTIVSGNDTVCAGSAAKTIIGSPAKGGAGTPTYQWISSSSANGTYTSASGTSNTVSYSPGVLSQTTFFKRVVTNGVACKDDTSASVFVRVDPALTAGTLTSSAQNNTICSGSTLSFTITDPTGGTPSAYKYQWQSSVDGTNWSNITNATNTGYSLGVLTASTYFRRVITSLKCSANSNQLLINVDNPVTTGTNSLTSGNQLICQTTIPSTIVSSTPTGGKTPISYTWISTPTVASINASTTKDLAFAATLSSTTVIRRIVTSTGACKQDTSNAVTITIDPTITDAGTISSNTIPANVCSGSAPSLSITNAVPASSSYTYQWQTSSDNTNWTNISGATSANLNPAPTINASTYFRRIVNSTKCSATSLGFLVSVDIPITSSTNTIASNQDICQGSTPKTLIGSEPKGGLTSAEYTWVSSTTGSAPWTNVGTGQNLDFTTGLTTSTFYKRIVTSTGACKNDTSSGTVKVNVDPKISDAGTITPANLVICSGNSPVINGTAATGGTAPLSYQWQYLDGANWVNVSAKTTQPGPLTTAPSIEKSTQYKRIVSSLVCSAESNVTKVDTVNGMKAGAITATKTELCAGQLASIIEGDATLASGGTGGIGNIKYQWQQSTDGIIWSDLPDDTLTSYTPGALTGVNYFRRRATNGIGTCDVAFTSPVTISQYEKQNPGTILSNDTTVCFGSSVNVNASLPTLGSPLKKYTWSIANAPSFVFRDTLALSDVANLTLSNLTKTTKVKRIVKDDCGFDTTSKTYTVLVNPLEVPTVSITTDLNQTFCNNTDVTVVATTSKAGVNRIVTWLYNGNTVKTVPDSIYVIAAADLVNGAKIKAIVTKDPTLICTAGSSESAVLELKVNTTLSENTVDEKGQKICVGQIATDIVGSNPKGSLATPGYAWQVSKDEQNWMSIPNATGTNYQPVALQGIYFYRRIALSAGTCANDTSKTHAKIIADSVVTAGVLTVTIDTVCKNGVSQIIATLPTGGVAPYKYQWQSSQDNVNFSDISGETNADIVLQAINSTTYFRRRLTTATDVCSYPTNTVKITVTEPIQSGTNNLSSGNESKCGASVFSTIKGSIPVGGLSRVSYKWQSSADGINAWTDIANSNTQDYIPGSLSKTTFFRRIVTSTGKCPNNISNSIRLFVDSAVTAGEITALASLCGKDLLVVNSKTSATGGTNGFSYSWSYKTATSTAWSSISGNKDSLKVAIKDIDNKGTITQFYFRRTTTSNGAVCSSTTDSVGVTVCQKPTSIDTLRSGIWCANETLRGKIITLGDKTPNKGGILKVDPTAMALPKHGSLNINVSDSTFTYIPNTNYIGKDTAVFAICDISTTPNQCVNKPLYITIFPVNDAPIVLSETFSTYRNQAITGFSITANDRDFNNDTLFVYPSDDELYAKGVFVKPYKKYIDSLIGKPKHGKIVMSSRGDFTYEPDKDFVGTDQAVFWVCDFSSTFYCNGFTCKKDTVTFEVKPYRIFVPEGYSPNGDGVNDYFVIRSEVELPIELKVFNRWGNLVYENKDYKNDWNGKANRGLVIGEGLPDGTYYVYVNVNNEIPDKDRFQYITISR